MRLGEILSLLPQSALVRIFDDTTNDFVEKGRAYDIINGEYISNYVSCMFPCHSYKGVDYLDIYVEMN